MKQLRKKLSSVEHDTRILEETNEELMKKYAVQGMVAGNSLGNLVKSIPTRFVGLVMCIR